MWAGGRHARLSTLSTHRPFLLHYYTETVTYIFLWAVSDFELAEFGRIAGFARERLTSPLPPPPPQLPPPPPEEEEEDVVVDITSLLYDRAEC